jgi:anti-sigma regulatory factor (Ser/Thr protein kinase)
MADPTITALEPKPPLGGPRRQLRLAIAGGLRAPERARAWLQSGAGWLPEELESPLLLLVCELVNNAVRHGGAGDDELIELELRTIDGGVGVQVTDPGPGFAPAERECPVDEPGGWGLVLVDQMSVRWGVVHDGRTRVWFELAWG